MSEPVDLKIPLQRDHRGQRFWSSWMSRPTDVTRALPIYRSLRATMCHRVRSGHVHEDHSKPNEPNRRRVSFALWCGMQGRIDRWGQLFAVPPDGYPLCGTCEGRAVGAGYPGIAILQQRYALLYSPREGRAPASVRKGATA